MLIFGRITKANNLFANVFFHGFVSGKKKMELFKNANIFAFPTRYKNETFPLSILESLSYGVPIIATNEGSIPDILDNQSGIILMYIIAFYPISLNSHHPYAP